MTDNESPISPASSHGAESPEDALRHQLRDLFEASGRKHSYFAERLGIKAGTLSAFLTGRNKKMRPEKMERLWEFLKQVQSTQNVFPIDGTSPVDNLDAVLDRITRSCQEANPQSPELEPEKIRQHLLQLLSETGVHCESGLEHMSTPTLIAYYGLVLGARDKQILGKKEP